MRPRSWRAHLPAGRTVQADELTARRSLPSAWAGVWADAPGAPVLLDVADPGTRWCTAGELEERTRRCAAGLHALGLQRGDRVLWSTGSSVPAVVANIAALRAGLVVVPANPAYTTRELAHIVGDVRLAAAIVDDPARAGLLSDIFSGQDRGRSDPVPVVTPDLREVSRGPRAVGRVRPPASESGEPLEPLDESDPADPALIAYTSGTTGAPKGAVLTHANLLANSEAVALTWRWSASDRLVHALPVFHGHGLCVAMYTTLLTGASAVLLPHFDADAVLDARAAHEATLFFGVPTMYHRLAGSSRVGELARLRLAVSGSAPLSAELQRSIAALAGVEVLERYGMTETLMALSNPYDGERRPGTVGFPFPGVEARLDQAEASFESATDATGSAGAGAEIMVRGPAVFVGYWGRAGEGGGGFDDAGWFHTGDRGVVEDGYVRILGRSTDLVISGGYNVYPAEVEDVLLGHPSVAEVAVTGTPSDEWGEVVTAWVVADAATTPDAEALMAYAAAHLAPYKRPRLVRFVDALPRNAMGKVRRSDLR